MRIARAVGTQTVLCCSLIFASLFANVAAQAASISYGNFGPVVPGVTFINVTESSGTDDVPLYGPPSPFVTGLDFEPTSFVSSATNGNVDFTDGQLNFAVHFGGGINDISLFEAGDYSLVGAGTSATSVYAGAILRATLTELNGASVAPVELLPSNASVGFALPPSVIVNPWSLGTSLNVDAQVKALYGAGAKATRVEVSVNNQLVSISQSGTGAFIAKKQFTIDVDVVPEPSTVVLVAMALGLLGIVVNRSSR